MAPRYGTAENDKQAREIVTQAYRGLAVQISETEDTYARHDFLVVGAGLRHNVEVKQRNGYDFEYMSRYGPLIDTSKVEAMADMAEEGERSLIIWRSSDGWLIGQDAAEIALVGYVKTDFQRFKGGRSGDAREKSATIVPIKDCYVAPAEPRTDLERRLVQTWKDWING